MDTFALASSDMIAGSSRLRAEQRSHRPGGWERTEYLFSALYSSATACFRSSELVKLRSQIESPSYCFPETIGFIDLADNVEASFYLAQSLVPPCLLPHVSKVAAVRC